MLKDITALNKLHMESMQELFSSFQPRSITDYILFYNQLKEEIAKKNVTFNRSLSFALLSSFTIQGLKESLFVICCKSHILPAIYLGKYNQYVQEIFNPQSQLYAFKPDIVILAIDTQSLLGEFYFNPYAMTDEERRKWVHTTHTELLSYVSTIKKYSSSKILLHNCEVPSYSPMGIIEQKQSFGFIEMIEQLNYTLKESLKNDHQAYIFDYNAFTSYMGKRIITDPPMYYLGDFKLDMQHFPLLAQGYLSYIKPVCSLNKKCIVLDLDNTLWGGIVGEDGIEGIQLGHTPTGKPFIEFQKHLLALFNRGIILAVNSNNNLEDALKVFREHPDMVLKEKHFASLQINWNDKVSKMKAIAQEISIGTDSLVFFDDDMRNRELVKEALPEVVVVDVPEDPALYSATLMALNDFNTLQLTPEDTKRGEMYAQQRERHILKESVTNIDDYLKRLETRITIEKATPFTIPRIAQLSQKTNQFNMTTKRYTEEDISQFSSHKEYLCFAIKIEDTFGDQGYTGVVIIKQKPGVWHLDTFLLSCRVLGRKVEDAILGYIINEAQKSGVKKLEAVFIPTKKNIPAQDFYHTHGFTKQAPRKDAHMQTYTYTIHSKTTADKNKIPGYISIIKT